MFDINRIVILILICALLYALYMYQQQLPIISFIGNKDKKAIKQEEPENSKKQDRRAKRKPTQIHDNTDLISIDNMSKESLGSLLDLDDNARGGGGGERGYKKASELNSLESAGTFGSLLNEDEENENFFFR